MTEAEWLTSTNPSAMLAYLGGNPLLPDHNLPPDQPFKAALLRDIFGNPWRPVPARPEWLSQARSAWLTPTAYDLARAIYDTRDWAALPILADALEEAGCPAEVECPQCEGDGDARLDLGEGGVAVAGIDCRHCGGSGRIPNPLLAHLRGPGPHARGCWALDLLLGKE